MLMDSDTATVPSNSPTVDAENSPFASVVVCTRNRSTFLAEACRAILEIEYPEDRWELLIVDNDSTDDTLDVALDLEKSHPHRVRVMQEKTLGLSSARNAGFRAARGEIVAFIDDDAFPDPGWLQNLVEALEMPGVLAAGGPVEPLFQGELPDWFGHRYLPYLTVWDKGPELLDLTYNDYPRGANLAFRASVFQRFGGFSHKLGRIGKNLLSCEEIELCLRIERSGGRILYVPGAQVEHLTVTERITPDWLADRFAAQGRSEAIVDWIHGGFTGLVFGLKRFVKAALVSYSRRRQEGGRTFAHCQRRALGGYLRGLFTAPFTVDRYRPSKEAGEVASWRPLV